MATELPTIKTSDAANDFIDVAYTEGITPVIVDKVGQVTMRMGFPVTAGLVKQFVILSRAANCNVRFALADGQDIQMVSNTGVHLTSSEFEPGMVAGNLVEFLSIPTLVNGVRTNGVFLTSITVE